MSREYPPMKGFPPFFYEKGVYFFHFTDIIHRYGSAPSGPLLLYNDMYNIIIMLMGSDYMW